MSKGKLKKLVETLDLSEVDKFQQKRRQKVGRKGNKLSSYVRAWLLKHILGIPSEAQLAERIRSDEELRKLCKFRKSPCNSAYCRARKRLGLQGIGFLFDFLVKLAKKCGIAKGRLVAIDSTDFEACCKGNKKMKLRYDQDARWGYSTMKGRVFGYKAHIICDAESELPLAVEVLPANVNDAVGFFPVFEKFLKNFGAGVWKFLADCAYDALSIRKRLIGMIPLIARNGRGKFKSENPKDRDYGKRWAVERLNSRIKEELGLDNLRMKGLWAATFHATLVLCSKLYAAVGSYLAGFKDWNGIVNLR
jgi:transposase